MLYFATIALQGFCIYHSIKYRTAYYWIFLIVFLPVIGSVIYILTQVYNKRDATLITAEVTRFVNPTKKVSDLKRQVDFSDTYQNRVNLADAYFELGDNDNAIQQYKAALDGNYTKDFYVVKHMIEAHYRKGDFEAVIGYAEGMASHPEFKTSRVQFLYGLALKEMHRLEEAKIHLEAIDIRFSFYEERVVLGEFLLETNTIEEGKAVLEAVLSESKHMTTANKRLYKAAIAQAQTLLNRYSN